MTHVKSPLSYANPGMSRGKRLFLRLLERSSGIARAQHRYLQWRATLASQPEGAMNRLLDACDMRLRLRGAPWPPPAMRDRPLLIVANHPFGIPDGVVTLALGERTGRPVRILINADLLRIPEMQRWSLPIDFAETAEARRVNLASGREAIARLKAGEIIVIFPSGGIATATWPLGRAADLSWKSFVAKLVHRAQADVVPLYFPGQNSWRFHAASQVSMFWRLSLVLPEALRRMGREIEVRVGDIIPYEAMAEITDRNELTAMLRRQVFALAKDPARGERVGRIGAMRRAERAARG